MDVRTVQDIALPCGSYQPRWYVVQTRWQMEDVAAGELVNQSFTVYCPKRQAVKKRIGGELAMLPLFPRYIFVEFDVESDPWRYIYGTPGVVTIFGETPERPLPVPRGVVEELLMRPEILADVRPISLAGASLRIEGGAWDRFVGVCQWSTDKRVGVLMSLFGRSGVIIAMNRDKVKVV